MYVSGANYRLTKHGRKRYLERVGQTTDRKMILHAIKGDSRFRFVWKQAVKFCLGHYYPKGAHVVNGYKLVTVLLAIPDRTGS